MNRRSVSVLLAAGSLTFAGCSSAPEPLDPSASLSPPQTQTVDPPAPSPGLISPAFVGMRWIEAQGRASAAGITVVPVISGPPGPVRPECQVVQQNPPPGVTIPTPVVTLVLTCPPVPSPGGPTPQ